MKHTRSPKAGMKHATDPAKSLPSKGLPPFVGATKANTSPGKGKPAPKKK